MFKKITYALGIKPNKNTNKYHLYKILLEMRSVLKAINDLEVKVGIDKIYDTPEFKKLREENLALGKKMGAIMGTLTTHNRLAVSFDIIADIYDESDSSQQVENSLIARTILEMLTMLGDLPFTIKDK